MGIFEVLSATWPAAETWRAGPWTIRRGAGGGQRVSAATFEGASGAGVVPGGQIGVAEAAMIGFGQRPLFMIRPGEEALDAGLAARGYAGTDATALRMGRAADLMGAPEERAIFCEGPLAVMREIWAANGVGPGRLAVMARVAGPRVWLLGRMGDRPVGAGFVGLCDGVAMLHSLCVLPEARRAGVGAAMSRAAARWAFAQGGRDLALAVVRDNRAAQGLYDRLGLPEVAGYHYRRAPAAAGPVSGLV